MQYSTAIAYFVAGTLKVIDFGLSKRYVDDQGRVIPRRDGRAGFRGSTAYASIFAHEELEQGDIRHSHHILRSVSSHTVHEWQGPAPPSEVCTNRMYVLTSSD